MANPIAAKAALALAASTPTLPEPTVRERLDATGLISSATADIGITLECRTGRFSAPEDWIEIQSRNLIQQGAGWGVLVPAFQINTTEDTILPVTITAPASTAGFVHGSFELRYALYLDLNGVAGDLDEFSDPTPFKVDRIAPYRAAGAGNSVQPPIAPYPNTVPTPITQTYIANNPTTLITVPANNYGIPSGQWQPGDMLQFYLSPNMFPQAMYAVGAPVPMLQGATTFSLPSTAFVLNGLQYWFYTVTDRAGNISLPSIPEARPVLLLPPPEQKEIFFPLAPAPDLGSADNLLNVVDYAAGIEAQVRTYQFYDAADRIEIKWGSQPYSLLSAPFTTFPLVFKAGLNALIRAEYGAQQGPQPTTVLYRIVRGNETFDSLPKTVMVDLSVRGAVNPGEPGTVNTNLLAAEFFGQNSNVSNELHDVDSGFPVRVTVPIWLGLEPPQAGDVINFVRPDGVIVQPSVDISTLLPGAVLDTRVPWAEFEPGGNNLQSWSYIVTSPATTNANPSPATSVNVIDAVTQALPPPVVQRLQSGQLTCSSLGPLPQSSPPDFYGEIFVAGDPRMVVGQLLELTILVFRPRVGTVVQQNSVPLRQLITPAIVLSGFMFRVPYRPVLITARLGTLVATVSTVFAGGVIGRGSVTINARTVLSSSNCDLTPVPAGP